MKNFNFLNNLKWLLVPLVLLTIGVGNVWGVDNPAEGSWSFAGGLNASWTQVANGTGYCGGWGCKGSTTSYTVRTTSNVSDFTTILTNASYSNFSLTITVRGVCNSGTNRCTVTLLNSSNTKVGSLEQTINGGFGSGTNAASADDVEFTFTPTSTVARIQVTGYNKTAITNVSYSLSYTAGGASCTDAPTVTAPSNSSVSLTQATLNCSSGVSAIGSNCTISSYGYVWGTSTSPTIEGTGKHEVGTAYTVTGTDFGSYTVTGLTPNTTYYYGAYATNGAGTSYNYNSGGSFTTKALTATRNNSSLGGVPTVVGNVITGSPNSGCTYADPAYTITTGNGSTTVEKAGNTFTVTSSTSTVDVNIQINYAEKGCDEKGGTNVTSGSSSSVEYGPIRSNYNYSTRQILYTKEDLDLAAGKKGDIKSIYFYYTGESAMAARNITIYMANTSLTALSNTSGNFVPSSEFTQVYSGSFSCSSTGWYEIMLDDAFAYNGVGNLVVLIDDNTGTWESSKTFTYHTASTTTGAQIHTYSDSKNEDPASTIWTGYTAVNYRPKTKFCIDVKDMPTYTVNWYVNGSVEHSQTGYEGTTLTSIPTPVSGDCDGEKVFVGWCATTYSNATMAPTFVSPTTMPNGGANYYAVFANSTTNYKKGAKADLREGVKVVLVNGTNAVSSESSNANKLDPVSISSKLSDNVIADPSSSIIWSVALDGDKYKFKQSTNYLNATSGTGKTGNLLCSATSDSWSIKTSSTYYYLQSTNASSRKLEYYSGNFTAYNDDVGSAYWIDFYVQVFENYATSCCEKLGSVSATNSAKTGTTANFTWSTVTGAEKYQVKVVGSSSHNDWTDATSGVTVSGLTAGTEYTAYFRAIDTNGSNCSEGPESTIEFTTPKITLGSASGTSTYNEGSGPGSKQTFTVTAVGLTGNLTVTAPTNFAVCATESGSYTSSITLTPTSGAVSTTVYFQLVAGKTAAASPYAGNVTVSGGSATEQTVAVNGTVNQACADPTITVQPAASASYNLNVSASALSVTATKNGTGPALTYQWYSNTANSKTTPTPTPIDGATSASYTPPTTATGTKYYFCEVSSGACAVTTNISAITVNTPSITVSETSIAFGDKAKDGSHTETFTVTGTNLASSTGLTLAVTGSSYFTIDKTSVAQTSAGAVSETTITVTYAPTVIGNDHSATITISSTGATNKTVTLSGNSKYKITWVDQAANPATETYTYVASGKPTFPSNPSGGCDSYTYFYGWAEGTFTTPVTAPTSSSTIKVYKSASEMPNVSGNVTYYAVWGDKVGEITHILTPTSTWSGYNASTINDDQGSTWSYYATGSSYDNKKWLGLNSNSNNYNIGSPTFSGNVKSIKAFIRNASSTETRYVYVCSSDETAQPSSGDLGNCTVAANNYTELTFTISGSFNKFYLYTSAALNFNTITVVEGSADVNCVTSCCTEVAARSGSVTMGSTSATVSWSVTGTAASKISSWDVSCKVTSSGAAAGTKGSITTVGTTKSITFTGLNSNTGYTFHILGTSNDDAYCDVDDELTGTTECLTPALSVTGTWGLCAGEELSLSLTSTSNIDPSATYQWQKYIDSDWENIPGATNSTYTVASCTKADAGSYQCIVTNPGTGSCSATSAAFGVKVYTVYIDDGNNTNWHHVDLTNDGTSKGKVTITLDADKTYHFKIYDNNNVWYGQTGTDNIPDATTWTLNGSNNVNLATRLSGGYLFEVNYASTPTVKVTFPEDDQVASKKIWFDNSIRNWSTMYYRVGNTGTNQNSTSFTLVPGTDKFYVVNTLSQSDVAAWHIANNASWAGSGNSIYKVDGSGYAITEATAFQKYLVGSDGVTLVPVTPSTGTSSGCAWYDVTKTDGMLTHTATITTPSHGTITIANAAQSLEATTTTADLPHRTILTVTATPATGYNLTSLTVNGAAFTSGNTHILAADATIAATFTAKVITVTWNVNGGNTLVPGTSSYTYDGDALVLPTPTKDGKVFVGWYTLAEGGDEVTNVGGANKPTADVEYFAHWSDGNTVQFHAGVGSVSPSSLTQATLGGAVAAFPTPTIDCEGWSFAGWKEGSAQAETTTNPEASLYAGGHTGYVPATATVNMYAVWKKNFGGGSGTVTNTYTWEETNSAWLTSSISNKQTYSTIAHSGTYAGEMSATSAYVQFLTKLSSPLSFKIYYTQTSNNDNSANKWNVQISDNGSSWTTVTSSEGANKSYKNTWRELDVDLSSYSNKYVRVAWGSANSGNFVLDDVSVSYTGTIPDAWKWTSSADDYGCVSANQVKTPVISPNTEAQTGDVSVTITCATDGATIRYTTDGTDPTSSSGTVYSGAFTVSCSATVKAIAYKATMDDSEIASQAYTITVPTPTFSLDEGTYYDANQSVTLSLPTAHTGTVIKYTTNGDDPTSSSATYSSAITVTEGTTTIKAIGYNSTCGTSSSVASATYIVRFGTDYTLVTDANDLMAGDQLVIISADAGTSSKYAISTTISANKRTSTNDYNINAGLTTAKIYPAVGAAATVQVFTLGGEPGAWTFHETTNDGYLNCPSAGKLTNTATVSNSNKWTIAIASNIATIHNNEVDATIKSNTGAGHVFAAYAPATENVQLVKLYSIPNPDPVIKIDADLSAFSACRGTASDYQSFYISGKNLDGNIVLSNVAPLAGYEFCLTSGGTYTATLELTPVSKTVAKTQVFVRLAAGATAGTKNGNLNAAVSANSLSTNIAVTGSVSTADTYTDQIHNTVVTNQCGEYLAPSCPDASAPADESCVETHFKFMGWITEADKNASGVKDDAWYVAHLITAGTAMTADGTNYYAVWAKEED